MCLFWLSNKLGIFGFMNQLNDWRQDDEIVIDRREGGGESELSICKEGGF